MLTEVQILPETPQHKAEFLHCSILVEHIDKRQEF